jgi:hypothetical protein
LTASDRVAAADLPPIAGLHPPKTPCEFGSLGLLSISVHTAVWHYLLEYIETAQKLTYWKEVALRAAYPVVVLLLLWNLKGTLLR